MTMKIDDTDKLILSTLHEDSRLSMNKIAGNTGLKPTTIHNRIKKLTEKGIIEKYTIKLNKKELDGGIIAYILLKVSDVDQEDVVQHLMNHKEVEEAAIVTGDTDIIFRVRVWSIEDLNQFILKKLRKIVGITNSTSMISLDFKEK